MAIVLSTVEEAISAINQLERTPALPGASVAFAGELAGFTTIIEGANYHGTVPAALARGLWEFQEELYRAVAFALYGEDNIRRLTDEQKLQFELVFKVTEGSSDLFASIQEFLAKLADSIQTMDSTHKMRTIISIAIILATVYGAVHIADTVTDASKHEVTTQASIKEKEIALAQINAQEQAKTAQFQLISDITKQSQTVARFGKATEEGAKAIIKGASDATRIRVGKNNFNRDDIVEVNQRATKEKAEARMIVDEFNVIRAETRDGGVTRFWLRNSAGDEFTSVIIDDDFDAEGLNRLWKAFRGRTKVQVELNATYVRGQVKNSSILRAVEPVPQSQGVEVARVPQAVTITRMSN